MSPAVISYPAFPSGEPHRLNTIALGLQAGALRQQLFGFLKGPLDVRSLAARTTTLVVNERRMRVAWDFDHEVRDEKGKRIFGLCEHDPEIPDLVMIGIDGPSLAERAEVCRSTAVHELAHAIFDMPAVLGKARKAFQTAVHSATAQPGVDWSEWRADTFMGAFLAPLDQLSRAVVKQAAAMNIGVRWRSAENGRSTPSLDVDPNAYEIDWLVDALAEAFGLTPAFMAVRLKKGGFIGSRPQAKHRRQ